MKLAYLQHHALSTEEMKNCWWRDDDKSGKSRAKWVRSKEPDPQCYHESSSQSEIAEGQHQAEDSVNIDPETPHESDSLGNFLDKAIKVSPPATNIGIWKARIFFQNTFKMWIKDADGRFSIP